MRQSTSRVGYQAKGVAIGCGAQVHQPSAAHQALHPAARTGRGLVRMSELSALGKRVAALWVWRGALRSRRELLEVLVETVELKERTSKLVNKMGALDPVTGLPRYGDQAKGKIVALAEEVSSLLSALEEDQVEAQRREDVEQAIFQAEAAAKAEAVVAVAALADQSAAIPSDIAESDEERSERLGQEAAAAERALQLAREAEALRQQRTTDKKMLQLLVGGMTNTPRSTAGFEAVLPTLTATARDFLCNLLSRILAAPNDVNLRRVRLDHPVVIERLKSSDESITALLEAGFSPHLETAPDRLGDPSVYRGADGPISTYERILHLSANTFSHVIFYMEEPSVDDSARWLEWYDRLSYLKDLFAK